MPKWIVTVYLPQADGSDDPAPTITEFDDDAAKNEVVEAARAGMRVGKVAYATVEEPATGGFSRLA